MSAHFLESNDKAGFKKCFWCRKLSWSGSSFGYKPTSLWCDRVSMYVTLLFRWPPCWLISGDVERHPEVLQQHGQHGQTQTQQQAAARGRKRAHSRFQLIIRLCPSLDTIKCKYVSCSTTFRCLHVKWHAPCLLMWAQRIIFSSAERERD